MKYLILIIVLFILPVSCTSLCAQEKPVSLTKAQAVEDFKWLRFALEYCHPRLYKYDDKKTVDARFDSLSSLIGNEVSGLDFLGLVSAANASVEMIYGSITMIIMKGCSYSHPGKIPFREIFMY
jgi:hypothetical protein